MFIEIKNIIDEYKKEYIFKNTIINCDFEKSLINSIRDEFKGVKIYGCYFHCIKALWKKSSDLSLRKKPLLEKLFFP